MPLIRPLVIEVVEMVRRNLHRQRGANLLSLDESGGSLTNNGVAPFPENLSNPMPELSSGSSQPGEVLNSRKRLG